MACQFTSRCYWRFFKYKFLLYYLIFLTFYWILLTPFIDMNPPWSLVLDNHKDILEVDIKLYHLTWNSITIFISTCLCFIVSCCKYRTQVKLLRLIVIQLSKRKHTHARANSSLAERDFLFMESKAQARARVWEGDYTVWVRPRQDSRFSLTQLQPWFDTINWRSRFNFVRSYSRGAQDPNIK